MGRNSETAIPAPLRWNRGNTKSTNKLQFDVPDASCAGNAGRWKGVFISMKERFRAIPGRPSFSSKKLQILLGH